MADLAGKQQQGVAPSVFIPMLDEELQLSNKQKIDVPDGFELISEGKGKLLAPKNNKVFYNPAMVNNRDLSIAALRQFSKIRQEEKIAGKNTKLRPGRNSALVPTPIPKEEKVEGLRILEGLAASGLRSIRYAKEVENIGRIDAVDLEADAVRNMQKNIDVNGVENIVKPHQIDARLLMLQRVGWYDVVDLDPYGSPVQFLDAAVQALNEGGLLMVTATDMAVLCGTNPEACFSKYGSMPLHKSYHHEQALRIVLHAIQQHAGRYKRYIVPLLSVSMDYWVRVFVRVYSGAEEVKKVPLRTAYVYQVHGFEGFTLHPLSRESQKNNQTKFYPSLGPPVPQRCPETQQPYQIGGPIWLDPLHDMRFVEKLMTDLSQFENDEEMFPARKKIFSTLTAISEELVDVPLFYDVHALTMSFKVCAFKTVMFKSALIHAGYEVSSTHTNDKGVKTNASLEVILDIMRCWCKNHPPAKPIEDPKSIRGIVLAKEPTLQANFNRAKGSISKSQFKKQPRFVQNPDNWGPRRRHGKRPLEFNSHNGHKSNDRKYSNERSRNSEGQTKHPKLEKIDNPEDINIDINDNVEDEAMDVNGE